MQTTTYAATDRTDHLLALMRKGDDEFNARDFATVERCMTGTWSRTSPGMPSRSTAA